MNEQLWERFEKAYKSSPDDLGLYTCHGCPFAFRIEKERPKVDPKIFPGLDKSFRLPVDYSTLKPNKDDFRCQVCFNGWVDEQIDKGKICIKCSNPITRENLAAVTVEETEAEGPHKGTVWFKHTICNQCFNPILEAKIQEAGAKRGHSVKKRDKRSIIPGPVLRGIR